MLRYQSPSLFSVVHSGDTSGHRYIVEVAPERIWNTVFAGIGQSRLRVMICCWGDHRRRVQHNIGPSDAGKDILITGEISPYNAKSGLFEQLTQFFLLTAEGLTKVTRSKRSRRRNNSLRPAPPMEPVTPVIKTVFLVMNCISPAVAYTFSLRKNDRSA